MRKLSTQEVKDRNQELTLSPAFIRDVEVGNIELYAYTTKEEKGELLQQDWCYHASDEGVVGLRIDGAKLGWS